MKKEWMEMGLLVGLAYFLYLYDFYSCILAEDYDAHIASGMNKYLSLSNIFRLFEAVNITGEYSEG